MSAGMAYEAMNNAGALKSNLIVVLNDNDMSIARPVSYEQLSSKITYQANYILVLEKLLK